MPDAAGNGCGGLRVGWAGGLLVWGMQVWRGDGPRAEQDRVSYGRQGVGRLLVQRAPPTRGPLGLAGRSPALVNDPSLIPIIFRKVRESNRTDRGGDQVLGHVCRWRVGIDQECPGPDAGRGDSTGAKGG